METQAQIDQATKSCNDIARLNFEENLKLGNQYNAMMLNQHSQRIKKDQEAIA